MAQETRQSMEESTEGRVARVSGPLVVAEGLGGTKMHEMVRIGRERLFGEVIEIRGDSYSIQCYEETEGVGPGDPVHPTGEALSVELGPGLVGAIYDGVQRPLDGLREAMGDYVLRGAEIPALDREAKWHFRPSVKEGQEVVGGDILGTVQETPVVEHRVMVPQNLRGKVVSIKEVEATIIEPVAVIEAEGARVEVTMMQRWPVRHDRPTVRKLPPAIPLITGQRVIDMLFPLAKGGTACVPGPFGSGKTVVQHQLAKWADADVIVYVGCGERGNEMADVLMEFPELHDPRSGQPLIKRTVLIANTSNMPVAAREASVFTGITIAEYFRDMGYDVALMADSTSRWAEAMREISGRLEEMPGEEGYPAYLASRIASFYERSGRCQCLGSDGREGSLSVVGAVSPPGGDLSEPVVQATLRVVQVFWSLEDKLAAARHFPAISWLRSYSLYQGAVDEWADKNVDELWSANRTAAMGILQRESELEELVQLVGVESLAPRDRLLIEVARMIREDFLHQSAFDDIDTYSSPEKQFKLLGVILLYYELTQKTLEAGRELEEILEIPAVEAISRAKRVPQDKLADFEALNQQVREQLGGEMTGEPQEDETSGEEEASV